jgi:hypothetical protein
MEITNYNQLRSQEVDTINRSGIDPYAPIRKVESYTPSGNLTGYGIEIEDAREGNNWNLVGSVSPNYLLVSNEEVERVANRMLGGSAFQFRQARVFFDGKRFMSMYMTDDVTREVQAGDELGLGVMFRNSYDGSTAFELSICALRLICTNGMLSKKMFARYRFKHSLQNINWEQGAEEALALIHNAPSSLGHFASAMRSLASKDMKDSTFRNLRTSVIPDLPASVWGKVVDRYVSKEESTPFGLLNAATNVLWHNRQQTVQDLGHNEYVTGRFVEYANTNLLS